MDELVRTLLITLVASSAGIVTSIVALKRQSRDAKSSTFDEALRLAEAHRTDADQAKSRAEELAEKVDNLESRVSTLEDELAACHKAREEFRFGIEVLTRQLKDKSLQPSYIPPDV